MIEEITIRGLGVIDDARLEWGPGLTVLTGETGAGKTMVLTALGLLLGARADPALIRTGAERIDVDAVVADPPAAAVARAEESGGVVEDGTLLLGRTATATRSRAFIGGRAVAASVLADLAATLVAVHGQADQQHLRRPGQQRDALDRFLGPGHLALVDEHRMLRTTLEQVRARLEQWDDEQRLRSQVREHCERGCAEIDQVRPEPGEDESLRARIARGDSADALHEALAAAAAALSGVDDDQHSAVSAVAVARKALGGSDDTAMAALASRAHAIAADLDALVADIAQLDRSIDADPAAHQADLERRARLRDLRRRWVDADPFDLIGRDAEVATDHADALLQWERAARAALEGGDDEEQRRLLHDELARLEGDRAEASRRLREARRRGARRMAAAVTRELRVLAMPDAEFVVSVTDAEPGPTGADAVTFAVRHVVGAEPVALSTGVSGGELSRVMLALEVVVSATDPVPTFVFDEVDAGIGGQAALAVGERLARLARHAQVLVVTHLPQVAAFADHHVRVTKRVDRAGQRSLVETLDDHQRRAELARMLAGLGTSAAAAAHVEELLASAHQRAGADA
jgi:DNA repair protein RecN (Recombination protein N)